VKPADEFQALQHLLRNLNDFPKLRKNALVVSLSLRCNLSGHALHARIRSAVAHSLATVVGEHSIERGSERAKRWQTIVERCDLNGEKHAAVAADLGLQHTQFYFERRAALDALAGALTHELDGISNRRFAIASASEMQIQYAIGLRECGRSDEVVQILERLIDSDDGQAQRLAAITELLATYDALAIHEMFPPLLDKARALANAASTADPAIETEMLVIDATAARVIGNGEQRIEALERARHRLRRMAAPLNRRTNDLLLRVLLHLTDAYVEAGDTAGTERYLGQAQEVFDRAPATRPQLRFWYLGNRAQLALFRGELLRGVEAMSDALAIARDNGLIRSMMQGSHFLGRAYFEGRQTAPARKHVHNAIVLSELLAHAQERANVSLLLANIERSSGHRTQALTIATKAHELFGGADIRSLTGYLTIAEALEYAGRPREALQLLDDTSAKLRCQGIHRFVGKAERIRSELYAKLKRPADAHQAINNAVEILESYGSLYELGTAYELSGRITHNRAHTKRAQEIRAQLTLPALH
jgi:tetratricopeptide (TPR) repeat protein